MLTADRRALWKSANSIALMTWIAGTLFELIMGDAFCTTIAQLSVLHITQEKLTS